MADTIIVDQSNRHSLKGVAGTYQIFNSNNEPVLKTNGKPWAGKTTSMGNYYGIIIASNKLGQGKYTKVRLAATWDDSYQIRFTPKED